MHYGTNTNSVNLYEVSMGWE